MAREGGGAGWRQGRADFLGTVGAAEPICAVNWFPHLTPAGKAGPLAAGFFALIVYRLGQEILNLQSGVRFPVGAPISSTRLQGRVLFFGRENWASGPVKNEPLAGDVGCGQCVGGDFCGMGIQEEFKPRQCVLPGEIRPGG